MSVILTNKVNVMLRHIAAMTVLFLFLPLAVAAETIHVPGDQPTIQAGIDAAVDGDTVLVADGTYIGDGNRDIDYHGKSITLRSENGPDVCVIDCQGSSGEPHFGFNFRTGESRGAVVCGFTIRNGWSDQSGGAICCEGSAPLIDQVMVRENTGIGVLGSGSSFLLRDSVIQDNSGTGIRCDGGDDEITGCLVSGNDDHGIRLYQFLGTITETTITANSANYGGGIWSRWGSFSISKCVISDNVAEYRGGGVHADGDYCYISNCLVSGNNAGTGGGLALISSSVGACSGTVYSSTITGNTAGEGGGLYCYGEYLLYCSNTILWGDEASTGPEISVRSSHPIVHISFSDVQGGEAAVFVDEGANLHWGEGMIDADPLFAVGPWGENYLSQIAAGQAEDSPCVDSGAPEYEPIDGTTRTDHVQDIGVADMGYHYPWKSVSAQLLCLPASGTVPFIAQIGLRLTNTYYGFTRKVGAKIDVLTAGGTSIPNWKTGWLNLASGASFTTSIIQTIPAHPTVIGTNTFTLIAEDVTPPPYNQPPYPPSGDTDSSDCTVTGIAP